MYHRLPSWTHDQLLSYRAVDKVIPSSISCVNLLSNKTYFKSAFYSECSGVEDEVIEPFGPMNYYDLETDPTEASFVRPSP